MAATAALVKEFDYTGNTRAKLYTITHDGSDTSVDILPGTGFTTPFGAYTDYTVSSGTFTFVIVAGTNAYKSHILFLTE